MVSATLVMAASSYLIINDVTKRSGELAREDVMGNTFSYANEVNAEMNKYVCSVCGYVYNPAEGDPDGDIPPGTPFEKLPNDWTCPVCGASKDQFEKQED